MNRNHKSLYLYLQITGIITLAIAATYFWEQQDKSNSSLKEHTTAPVETKAKGTLVTHDSDKAYPGITLIPVVGTEEILAVNMQGVVIHSWPLDAERARLLPSGNILTITGSKWGHDKQPWKDLRAVAREISWAGDTKWEYTASDYLHHDINRLESGNTLLLKRSFVPENLQGSIIDSERRGIPIRTDSVVEIKPDGQKVFEWHAYENLDLNYCGKRACSEFEFNESADFLDWTHINTANVLPSNKFYDSGDKRFKPGNLMVLPRNWWQILIIDRDTGKEVWRYRGDYRGGISGGHEAHMISPGLPGAGNILVLDNGTSTHKGQSIILEINPQTKEVVWKYENGKDFFTKSRGSVQRLENGNTLISEDRTGRVFEVTTEGEVVWSYKLDHPTNRAARYPISYCPIC